MIDWEIFGPNVFDLVQYSLWGILNGGIYALIALGIVVINKASGVFNFAHGWMMFTCGMFFWQFFANDLSGQMTFAMSGVSALLIIGIIASMGITTIATPKLVSTSPRIAIEKRQRRSLVMIKQMLGRLRRLFEKNQVTIIIIAGFVIWSLTGWTLIQSEYPLIRAAVATFIFAVILGLLIERFTIRPLLGQPVLTAILMTLALTFILHGVVQMVWGPEPRPIDIFVGEAVSIQKIRIAPGDSPSSFREVKNINPAAPLPDYRVDTLGIFDEKLQIQRYRAWGFGISLAAFVGFVILFRYTSIGLAMQATAENQVLAESVGLRVRLVLAIAWALVTVMAGIAGVILGVGGSVNMLVLPGIAFVVFPAVLLGGLDSIGGALAGGLIIGLTEQLAILYGSTTFGEQAMPFLVLMIVLIIRPHGLFGREEIKRV